MAKHPLQRLDSPARPLSFLFHLAGICSFLASFVYLSIFPHVQAGAFGGNFQFLTIIGLGLSLATFVVAYAADLFLMPEPFALKNQLAVCCAPLDALISILYWGLRTYDKSLIFPPDAQVHLPLTPDLGFHAAPALFLTLDLLLFSPPWTIRAREALGLSFSLALLYWGWVELCFSFNGFYPYPIFALLDTPKRAVLFSISAVLMTASTLLLKAVYGAVNGTSGKSAKAD